MYLLVNKQRKCMSLIETSVGLAIISTISVIFMIGLAMNFKGKIVQDNGTVKAAIVVRPIKYVRS